MSLLTPLRTKPETKSDPTPTNVAETLRQEAQAPSPAAQPPDDDDDEDDDDDDDDEDAKAKKPKKVSKGKKKTQATIFTEPVIEMDERPARQAERDRLRAICESDAGKLHLRADPERFVAYILGRDEDAQSVIATLTMFPPPARNSSLSSRMAAEPKHDLGPEPPPDATAAAVKDGVVVNPQALAAAIVAAGKKRRGEI